MTKLLIRSLAFSFLLVRGVVAADAPAAGKVGKLPHLEFDARTKQVRVECEMLGVNAPLEFFCCRKGTNDYESMIRSEVKPSDLHLALLAVGLKPGEPLKYSEALKKWFPPSGPPLQIVMEYTKDGQTLHDPAWKWMRDVKSKKAAPPFTWVFTGSRVMQDGKYAADVTGYLVSIVNFDLTVIDVPQLASSSNDLLEWERNPDVTPKAGAKVTMVIEPAGNAGLASPASQNSPPQRSTGDPANPATPANPTTNPAEQSVTAEIEAAQKREQDLKAMWERQMNPERGALRQAAEAHYKVVQDLRAQQQRLIDEADRLQRTIDELEKDYQDLTAPRPPQESGK